MGGGVETRRGRKEKGILFHPFSRPPPNLEAICFFLLSRSQKGEEGRRKAKKNLHLRIICRICPGKEDLKPSDNRRFSQINYFYKTVAVAKNGLGSEGTYFFYSVPSSSAPILKSVLPIIGDVPTGDRSPLIRIPTPNYCNPFPKNDFAY